MKRNHFINLSLILVLVISSSSCRLNDIEVASDYDYAGRFDKYRTFNFVNNLRFDGTTEDKQLLEKDISRVLEAWGYRQNRKRSNLMIMYSFYYDDIKMKGYNQPQFRQWVMSKYNKKLLVIDQDSTATPGADTKIRNRDENYGQKDVYMKEGTVLISFFDPKRDITVWQGYASGVFSNDEKQNRRILRSAIYKILDEYRLVVYQKT